MAENRAERFFLTSVKGLKIDKSRAAGPSLLGDSAEPSGAPSEPASKAFGVSTDLAAIVGDGARSRADVVSRIWEYIRKNNLQDPQDKRVIIADKKLRTVLGRDRVDMFELNKELSRHLGSGNEQRARRA